MRNHSSTLQRNVIISATGVSLVDDEMIDFMRKILGLAGLEEKIERCNHGDHFIWAKDEFGTIFLQCKRCHKMWDNIFQAFNEAEDRGYKFE